VFQIRIACKVLETEERKSESSLYDFLENCLRHKSEVSRDCHGSSCDTLYTLDGSV